MNLYFLRHTKAIEPGKGRIMKDDERPLSGKGEHTFEKIAKGMKRLDLEFDAIISGPALRTAQTSEIVAKVFDRSAHIHLNENLSTKGNPVLLIKEIAKKHSKANNILLVGHQASLTKLISVLLVGDEGLDIVFKKRGLCKLSVEQLKYGKCAALCWFITPAQLKLL